MKKKRKRQFAGPHHSTGQQVKQVREVKISNARKCDLTSPHNNNEHSLCNKRVSLHIKLVNNKQAANKHASLCAIMFLTKYLNTAQETAEKATRNKGGPRGSPPQRTGLEGGHEAEDQYNRHKNKRTHTQGTKDPELSRQWMRQLLS